ncbi:MAG TPA: hypothetical protein VEV41_18975 [Terriglobales bacterium]|nr:hypothetical protein [Terriglobales bacterium]
MRRFAYFAVALLLTSLFASADNKVIVRSVSVTGSNTYTIEGSGFSPKKGTAPVVTINGLGVIVKSFTDTRIVGTLATPVTGDYTVKITNSRGQSMVYTVVMPPQKTDSPPVSTEREGVNVAAYYLHPDSAVPSGLAQAGEASQTVNNRGCNPTAPPGIALPPLPAYCHEGPGNNK